VLAAARERPLRPPLPQVRLLRWEDDPPLALRVTTVPCAGGDGELRGWVVVLEDVTELHETARRREEGLAIATHELRSPLTALRALSQVLNGMDVRLTREQRQQALEAIEGETRRLGALVSKLLDTTHLEQGAYTLERTLLEPVPLLDRVVAVAAAQARARGIILAVGAPDHLPPLEGDGVRLEMALGNLVANALRYSPPGGRVTLEARAAGGRLLVSVTDCGPGVAEEEAALIFDKFSRGRSAAGGYAPGLGLGLYVARRIVELHGGKLTLSTRPGEGSTFTASLPLPAEEKRSAA